MTTFIAKARSVARCIPTFTVRGTRARCTEHCSNSPLPQYDLHRVCGRCDGRNAASVRSLQKAGLREEAHFVENEFVKGEWTDEIVLAILQSEWRAAQRLSERR